MDEPGVLRVAAAVIRRDGRLLLAQRGPGGSAADLWEFPGGKIEPGETAVDCLVRELDEELGIRAQVGAHLLTSRTPVDGRIIELVTHEVTRFDGEPDALAHRRLQWVELGELSVFVATHPVPAPDLPVLALLLSGVPAPTGR